jgi:hypothetical protein
VSLGVRSENGLPSREVNNAIATQHVSHCTSRALEFHRTPFRTFQPLTPPFPRCKIKVYPKLI